MTKTIYDLVTRAMRDRNILGATEEATALERKHVKSVYLTDMDELRDNGIAYWPDDEIPDAVMRAMSRRLGLLIADSFGLPRAPERELEDSLRPLRKHISKRSSGQRVKAEYF